MPSLIPSPLLRHALWVDGAGSLVLGALQVAAAAPLAGLTRLPAALIANSGLVMLAYAALLLALGTRSRPARAPVQAVAVGNALWALAALALALALAPAPAGLGLLVLHLLWTALFAALQMRGLARSVAVARENGRPPPAMQAPR